jgi:hypothetical protein
MKKTVLLHELAHAVHDKIFSMDNTFIENAYAQAMERGLYVDNTEVPPLKRYAATNAAEYFAEVSCAYLDQLDYKPKNADQLKDYDSVGYEIMEKAWGTLAAIKAEKEKDAKKKK